MAGSNRTALVTGASGGLGAALAIELARRGWTVFAGSRSGTAPEGARAITALTLDVTETSSVEAAVREILAAGENIDLVINNAGINFTGVAEEVPIDKGIGVMETNFFGAVRVTNAVLPHMRSRRSGTVLTIGSLAGLVAPPGEAFYAASKFALEGFLEALQHEVAGFGIRILLAEPGFIKTNLAACSPAIPARFDEYDPVRDALANQWKKSVDAGVDARLMAKHILDWTEKPGSRFRRRFGPDARWVPLLKALLPQSLFFAATRRAFGI
jgi:NAD(P)-dependent dehydrogenase (short-subunit alcohol dehydrogenase family)